MTTPYQDKFRWDGIKNDSGETCPAFGILVITGTEMRGNEFKRPVLIGNKPSTTFYREFVVNGPTPIPAGGYGRCTRGPGACSVKYDTGTPANGEGWGPKPGQWTASKGFPGITCEGIKDAARYILLGTLAPIGTLLGKTTSAITGGTSTTTAYQIWVGTSGSESNGGWTTVPGAISRVDIGSGKFVKLTFVNNGWIMEPLECG